jgi:hypothetical protein
LAELKRLPAADRYEKGKDHLRLIIEAVLARPNLGAAVEEAAVLCGKSIVAAQDLRAEVERASMVKPEPPPLQREIVRVLTDPDVVLRMRGSGEPDVVSEYNPFSNYWMGRR